MTTAPLTIVQARATGGMLHIIVDYAPLPRLGSMPEATIVDLLGRPVQASIIAPTIGDGATTLAIRAAAPAQDTDADPPSYRLTIGEHSVWFAPSSPNVLADETEPTKPPPGAGSIDYLGRDFTYFTTMMRSRLAQTVGKDAAWALGHPADPMTTILEVLAYAGDHLSFRQDAAGTESYLTTARRRLSLRYHARLRDYAVNDGCNARTALVFIVKADGMLPAGLRVVTQQPGKPDVVLPADSALAADSTLFETMHPQPVLAQRNDLGKALVQSEAYPIPAASISLTLSRDGTGLTPGQLIVLQQLETPAGAQAPFGAQVLRLLTVEEVPGQDTNVTTVLHWHPEDALMAPLIVPPADAVGAVSLYGNVVLADHGQTVPALLSADIVEATGGYRPTVCVTDVVSAAPLPPLAPAFNGKQGLVEASLMVASASASLAPDPRMAVPCITMTGERPGMTGVADVWTARRDLLSTAATERSFAVTPEDSVLDEDGCHLTLRFGDGALGAAPEAGTRFIATTRTGNGQSGRVHANSLRQVIDPPLAVAWVSNPLPASPSIAEETEGIRLFAATNFRTNLRGIEPDDWTRLAKTEPLVAEMSAQLEDGCTPCRIGLTTRSVISGDGMPPDDAITFEIAKARLMHYAVLGALPTISQHVDARLDIALVVYCRPGTPIGVARERLLRRIGTGSLPDGSPAFFHPMRWPLGRPVRLDALVKEIEADSSVSFVIFDPQIDPRIRFTSVAGGHDTATNVAQGHIEIGPHQRARMGNDAFRPAQGSTRLYLVATS